MRTTIPRRSFLKGAGALAATGLIAGAGQARAAPERAGAKARYLVPGYLPASAYVRGRPIAEHPELGKAIPFGYDGMTTMITRVDERDGSVRRALFPMIGHEITVAPDGRSAFFNAMDDVTMVTLDPDSLELGVTARPHRRRFGGGGHALYGADGGHLIATERRFYIPYTGRPEDHFGRLVVRDAKTLKVLEVYSSHGIAPHQLRLLEGENVVAVTHYGSTVWPDGDDRGGLPYIVEPCLTLVDLANGKLVHKEISPDKHFDLRHLAVRGRDRIFAIQGRLAPVEAIQKAMRDWSAVYEPDIWSASREVGYLPAPILRYDLTRPDTRPKAVRTTDPLLMRYGQSIVYDPLHDEVIATFPSRHAVVVFAGADGRVKRVIRTDRLGLHQPRGLAFHPDGRRYAVSGYWRNIHLFARGSHELDRDASIYLTFFGHSHSSVA